MQTVVLVKCAAYNESINLKYITRYLVVEDKVYKHEDSFPTQKINGELKKVKLFTLIIFAIDLSPSSSHLASFNLVVPHTKINHV